MTDHHGLPTPRTALRDDHAWVLVWCKACRRQADAGLLHCLLRWKGATLVAPSRLCRSQPPDGFLPSAVGLVPDDLLPQE